MHSELRRFLGYSGIGTSIFGCELIAFILMLKYTSIGYLGATIITFLSAITVQYIATRRFIFSKTDRAWRTGYVLFCISATAGVGLVSLLMVVLVEYFDISPLISRIIASGSVGYLIYLFNLHMTFRMQHPSESKTV